MASGGLFMMESDTSSDEEELPVEDEPVP